MSKIWPDQVILPSKGGDMPRLYDSIAPLRFTQSNQRNKHYTNKKKMHMQTNLFFPP